MCWSAGPGVWVKASYFTADRTVTQHSNSTMNCLLWNLNFCRSYLSPTTNNVLSYTQSQTIYNSHSTWLFSTSYKIPKMLWVNVWRELKHNCHTKTIRYLMTNLKLQTKCFFFQLLNLWAYWACDLQQTTYNIVFIDIQPHTPRARVSNALHCYLYNNWMSLME